MALKKSKNFKKFSNWEQLQGLGIFGGFWIPCPATRVGSQFRAFSGYVYDKRPPIHLYHISPASTSQGAHFCLFISPPFCPYTWKTALVIIGLVISPGLPFIVLLER